MPVLHQQHIAGTYNCELRFFGVPAFRFTACSGLLLRPEVGRQPM